jgi:hypothetical protein
MATHQFTIKEAILFGWEKFKKNWQFLIEFFVTIIIASVIPDWLHSWARDNFPNSSFLFSIIGWIVQMITGIGVIVISLKLVDGKKPGFKDIYKDYNLLLNYFLGSLLYGIVVIVGLILLVVPGIYWGIKYQYTTYLIIDKKMGVWEAFKKSGQLTHRVKLKLFLLGLCYIGITIVGVLLVGIGLLISWPVIALSSAYVYRKLSPRA